MKRQIDLDKAAHSNLQASTSFPILLKVDEEILEQDVNEPICAEVSGIIITNEENYIPDNVEIRVRISPKIFTANFLLSEFGNIKSDSKVESVSISERIPLIEPK